MVAIRAETYKNTGIQIQNESFITDCKQGDIMSVTSVHFTFISFSIHVLFTFRYLISGKELII